MPVRLDVATKLRLDEKILARRRMSFAMRRSHNVLRLPLKAVNGHHSINFSLHRRASCSLSSFAGIHPCHPPGPVGVSIVARVVPWAVLFMVADYGVMERRRIDKGAQVVASG